MPARGWHVLGTAGCHSALMIPEVGRGLHYLRMLSSYEGQLSPLQASAGRQRLHAASASESKTGPLPLAKGLLSRERLGLCVLPLFWNLGMGCQLAEK